MTEDQKCELEIAMVNATTKEQIDDLVKRGADVDNNSLLDNGMTLLMQACKYGDIEVALALIANKANVNAQDNNGKTALMYATKARENPALLIHHLHKNGAVINAQDDEGLTALMHSCINDNLEVFKTLIELDADINLKDSLGNSLNPYYTWYLDPEYEETLKQRKLRSIEKNKNQHKQRRHPHNPNYRGPFEKHRD